MEKVKCWACKQELEVSEGWTRDEYLAHHLREHHPGWPGYKEEPMRRTEQKGSMPGRD